MSDPLSTIPSIDEQGSQMDTTDVRDALAGVRALYERCENETDAERFLDLVVAMRDVKREVDVLMRDIDRLAADTFSGQKEWTIGKHALEIRNSKQRRWTDADGLRRRVSMIARFDPETGEERGATDALEIFTKAYRCGGAEARTTWLKSHDIDPDEYSEGEWRISVQISPAIIEPNKGEPA